VDRVAADTAPYLAKRWAELGAHPLVGEARIAGMMAALELSPDPAGRKPFEEGGAAGLICRDHCFASNLITRHVGDKMIISPPLVIRKAEIDIVIERAHKALDLTMADLKAQGLLA